MRSARKKLDRLFRLALLGAAAAGGAAAACSSSSGGGTAPEADAAAHDATLSDAPAYEDSPLLGSDAIIPDALPPCDAGSPVLIASNNCEDYFAVGCLKPADDAGNFTTVTCSILCPQPERPGTTPWSCSVYTGLTEAGPRDAGADGDADVYVPDLSDAAPPGKFVVQCEWCNGGGRRPPGFAPRAPRAAAGVVGRYLAGMGQLEAASVTAFRQLRRELLAHRAPRGLVARTARATEDEIRHARAMRRLAARFGAKPARASAPEQPVRSLEEIARDNAVEGCVRETYGALVTAWQAHHAADARIARAMRTIAREERAHAVLSWELARWLDARLDADARARVAAARAAAVAELAAAATPVPGELMRAAGLPSAAEARALLNGLAPLWA